MLPIQSMGDDYIGHLSPLTKIARDIIFPAHPPDLRLWALEHTDIAEGAHKFIKVTVLLKWEN